MLLLIVLDAVDSNVLNFDPTSELVVLRLGYLIVIAIYMHGCMHQMYINKYIHTLTLYFYT